MGIAAHWKYKQGDPRRDSDEQQFAWLRQLLEWQQQLTDPNEFLETVRVDLFPDEVYVFTPQGDVISLPSTATPIDFAYAVHTEVGHHCAGAKVNGKLVPLRHRLANGDTVEIVTSPHQRPRQEWLEFVVTGRARSRIRHFLRVQQVEDARTLGRQILQRELQRRGRSYDKLAKTGDVARIAKAFKLKSADELLQALAYGKIPTKRVVRRFVGDEEPPTQPTLLERVLRPVRGSPGVKVGGMDHVLVRFARCCNPLPGDPVAGFITRGRGVTVHTRDCPRIFHLDPERRVPVTWDQQPGEARVVKVRVVSENRTGLLAAVSKQISAEDINIMAGRIAQTGENRAVQTFDLAVKDRKHLDSVIKKLSKVKGILSVERVRG